MFRGRGGVNARSIGIELPGPARAISRSDSERDLLRGLLTDLRDALPSLIYLTGHQWIDPRKRDPGPGVTAEWFDGLGFEVFWRMAMERD